MSDQERALSADDQPFVPTDEPRPLPAGEAFNADPNTWYHLRVHYKDDNGNPAVGLMYPLGTNPSRSFWDYQVLGSGDGSSGPTKIKVHPPDPTGWSRWELDDGNWLSIKATGWIYRSSAYPIGWQIMKDAEGNSRLYNNYWAGEAGYDWRGGAVPDACYMGMKLSLFTCELVPTE